MIGAAPLWLSIFFSMHIVLVNLGIGFAWLVPYFKYIADKRNDKDLEITARELMRFYAATYALAGVFGTAFTVFLLSYYPRFIGAAGHIALVPFAISITAIAVQFFSIVAFWYGWDRFSRRVLYIIGGFLAASALLIPLGFRAVFAFLNIPAGLEATLTPSGIKWGLNLAAAFENPTFAPLYIKSIAGAFTLTFVVVLSMYLYRGLASSDNNIKERSLRVARMMSVPAIIGLIIMPVLGAWYGISLENVPYKFNNIFASLGLKIGDGIAYYNVSWLFITKLVFYAVQVIGVLAAISFLQKGSKNIKALSILFLVTAALAMGTVASGELLNAYSQYPFAIAAWPDIMMGHISLSTLVNKYGVGVYPHSSNAIQEFVNYINSFVLIDGGSSSTKGVLLHLARKGLDPAFLDLSLNSVNRIAVTKAVLAITLIFVSVLLFFAAWLLKMAITPKGELYS